jgi:hypothetical protein
VIIHDAGLTLADGTHHGIVGDFSPEAGAALCAALSG